MAKNKHTEQEEKQEVEQKACSELETKVAELEEQLGAEKAKVEELEDLKLRQMAEFDNYRRRTNKEKLELMETAGERIFTEMLPLVDDLERAMTAVNTSEDLAALKEGMNLIYQKFLAFLEQNNVNFSTDEHEAITTFAAGEDKKGKIIDCTQKGYKLGDKVIRFAKVVVGE